MNLYVHFPFCRRKCTYCALYSRAGASQDVRDAYVRKIADEIGAACQTRARWKTVYFGGGSPALCDLSLLVPVLRPLIGPDTEFTVELHPLDVSETMLTVLKDLGVNRISMGVQSLDDAILADMGRGYTVDEAESAFRLVKKHFDNAGIDLIVGYPGGNATVERLRDWGLKHCSVYSLILEEKSILGHRYGAGRQGDSPLTEGVNPPLPTDDEVMDQLASVTRSLADIGLQRYEISNYAEPGYECRHNLAVWRGEDYIGLGDGAFGRIGLTRTSFDGRQRQTETVDAEADRKERTLFRLRTREGLDASGFPEWGQTLKKFVEEDLLTQEGPVYYLTPRGMEVCDSILEALV